MNTPNTEKPLVQPMTPATPLEPGETVIHSLHPDTTTYIRDHAWMAAIAMTLGMGVLWATGNPHIWTGAIGGLAAIGLRGWYMASEELATRWDVTASRLLGPQRRVIKLDQIKETRSFASVVQVITKNGDKHLIKYQSDPQATMDKLHR